MPKIQIIEDNELLLKMYKSKFEKKGHQVVTSLNGEKGIEDAKREHPDFIVVDLRMPKLDGVGTVKLLKAMDATKDIPIAIFTVVNQESLENYDEDLKNHVLWYLRKDETTPSDLVSKVEEFLSAKRV